MRKNRAFVNLFLGEGVKKSPPAAKILDRPLPLIYLQSATLVDNNNTVLLRKSTR